MPAARKDIFLWRNSGLTVNQNRRMVGDAPIDETMIKSNSEGLINGDRRKQKIAGHIIDG